MAKADRVHSTPPINTPMRAWTTITAERTRLAREELADQISRIQDDELRGQLRQRMSALFLFLEDDLEEGSAGGAVQLSLPAPVSSSPPGACLTARASSITHETDVKRRDDQSPAHVPGVFVTRRSLMMNTMIALPLIAVSPLVATDVPDAELIDLIDQLRAIRPEYYKIVKHFTAEEEVRFLRSSDPAEAQFTRAEAAYDLVWEQMLGLERKAFAIRARTLAGVKAKARWYLDFYCCGDLEQIDGGDESVISLFKELTSITDGESPVTERPSNPSAISAAETVDPIFAAIAAHRSAYNDYIEAVTAADNCVPHPMVRIQVGMRDDADFSVAMIEGGGQTIICKPNGKKVPVYAFSYVGINECVPKNLPDADRNAWISERVVELDAEEQRIADERAKTPIGKLEAAQEDAYGVERDRMWDLIWTTPTTAGGLAALLAYSRERETMAQMAGSEWAEVLEYTLECAACAWAGLPKPPMNNVVAELWESGQEVDDAAA
jgi:hypothetical protein